MMDLRVLPLSYIGVFFLSLIAGCDSGKPPLASVQGKVSSKGVPLRQGTIVLIPDTRRGNSGPIASADIRADGSYTLRTGEEAGACPGWHRVTVVAVEAARPVPGKQFTAPRSLISEKYRDPELSDLKCEVRPDRDNVINFNLD